MNHSIQSLIATGVCAAAMLAATTAYAAANNDWYLGASGDLTWMRHSNMGGGGNVDLGYRFSDFRLEGEAGYHGADSTHFLTYMGNAYYDFNTVFPATGSGWHVVPYIGAGLGDAAVHYGNSNLTTTFHHHDNTFAYQGMAGLSFVSASMPNTDWSLGYRYLGTDKNNLRANSLELGLRFHF